VSASGGIEGSALGEAIRQSLWLFPVAKALHLGGVALLLGSIVPLDLRLLGFRRRVSAQRLARRLLPWTALGFGLIVPSGLVMFAADASELIAHPLFALKMGLILGAGANAALFHAGAFRRSWASEADAAPPAAARAAGAASLLLWISLVVCGRLLAGR
jgi:hypothetical protein